MRTDNNTFQSAVVTGMRVVGTLRDSTGNRMIGLLDFFHDKYHPFRKLQNRFSLIAQIKIDSTDSIVRKSCFYALKNLISML